MKLQLCAWLFVLALYHTAQAGDSIEISSVLNLHDEYLLLFTANGFVVSRNKSWCDTKVDSCPNLTASEVHRSDNVTEISTLWNNSQVVGLERVDASASFRNPFNHMHFAILIQIENDDLNFLVVSLSMQRIFAFGNGATLFGTAWASNSCLARIVDIVADRFESISNYIICRETDEANSTLQVMKASIDLATYHYNMLQPLNMSNMLSEPNLQSEISLPFYLGILLPAYGHLKRGPILSLELWNHQLILFHENKLSIILKNRINWYGPIKDVFSPAIPERSIPVTTPAPSKLLNDETFQVVQIGIILFSFFFLLGVFYLLWEGITQLSDYLHEGVWYHSMEPVWLSKYDLAN